MINSHFCILETFLVLLNVLFLCSCGASRNDVSQIDILLSQAIDKGDLVGVEAIVATPDDIIYHNAFGKKDVRNNIDLDINSLFGIASMGKAFTSLSAMMLYENGAFSLDDPITQYLPQYESLEVLDNFNPVDSTYTTVPVTTEITVRHLLTHTSGLCYSALDTALTKIRAKTGKSWKELPLVYQPGERWSYGPSTNVLGELIETISKQPLDVFFKREIFEPLEMNDTFFNIPDEKYHRLVTRQKRLASGELLEQENVKPKQKRQPTGGGGVYSTANDYMKFLQMLLNDGKGNGKRFVSKEVLDMMITNQVDDIPVKRILAADPTSWANDFLIMDGLDKFGFGFLLEVNPERNMRSLGSYSWGGARNTFFWVDPDKKIAAVFLTQVSPFCDERIIKLYRKFERLVYSSL